MCAINRFNGVDIKKIQDFIKIHNTTYIKKILSAKVRLHADIPGDKNSKYIPTYNAQIYNSTIEETPPIPTEDLSSIDK